MILEAAPKDSQMKRNTKNGLQTKKESVTTVGKWGI